MGGSYSVFTDQEMDDYLDLTYFTRKEINLCFKKFRAMDPEAVDDDLDAILPAEIILESPELCANPFADRMLKVFSSCSDEGDMQFEDYLDMMSSFSEEAPLSVKAEYVFKIFDFDEDDVIGPEDMMEIIQRLLGEGHEEEFPNDEIVQLIVDLTMEVDLDGDGVWTYTEFEHAVARSRDFVQAFEMRLN